MKNLKFKPRISPETKYPKLFIFSVGFFVLSLTLQVLLSNFIAFKSSQLTEQYAKKTALEKEIASMEYQDSVLSSLNNVEARAVSLGFTPFGQNVIALNISLPNTLASAGLR